MSVYQQEVVIVGAGPAGGVLSILLARSGIKVTLLERDTQLDRGFRGPAYQPSALRIWDEMDILGDIYQLEHSKSPSFSFLEKGEVVLSMDISGLPPPYNQVVVMKQAPLLRFLIKEASRYPNFNFLGGVNASGLIMKEGKVVGVTAEILGRETVLKSRLVVACDGRFSNMRAAVNIPLKMINQEFDVLWFDLPRDMHEDIELSFHLTNEGFLVFLPKEHKTLQVGLVLGKGGYSKLRKQGLEGFINQVIAVEPSLNDTMRKYITSWDQCELLDVKMGVAKEWCRDGLLLIGDSAHIASPIGGIGNKLAIEDAALVHPIILKALKNSNGPILKDQLIHFENNRRKDIQTALHFQKTAGRIILGLKNPFLKKLRSLLAKHMQGSFMYKKVRKIVALSPHDVHVDRSVFVDRNPKHLYFPLVVKNIVDETPSTKSISFTIPPEVKEIFQFKSGQFITLRDLIEGRLVKRCYSISLPEGNEILRITVKRQDKGIFSNHVHEEICVGDKVLVMPPSGNFVLSTHKAGDYIFFAAGSGVTPIFSLINTLLNSDPNTAIHLLNVNKTEDEIIFHGELQQLAAKYTNIHITNVHTQALENGWNGLKGRPDTKMLTDWIASLSIKDPKDVEAYICGPEPYMDNVKTALQRFGCTSDRIHLENFFSATGAQEVRRIHSKDQAEALEVGDPNLPHEHPCKVSINLNGQSLEVVCEKGETILDACLKSGHDVPFSCQEGICSTCKASLDEGCVYMDKHDALTAEEISEQKILTCRAKPQTKSCKIHYENKKNISS